MTEPVFLTIDLPPDAAAEDVSALRDYLENRITENEGMTAEVDVADPARAGGFENDQRGEGSVFLQKQTQTGESRTDTGS